MTDPRPEPPAPPLMAETLPDGAPPVYDKEFDSAGSPGRSQSGLWAAAAAKPASPGIRGHG